MENNYPIFARFITADGLRSELEPLREDPVGSRRHKILRAAYPRLSHSLVAPDMDLVIHQRTYYIDHVYRDSERVIYEYRERL